MPRSVVWTLCAGCVLAALPFATGYGLEFTPTHPTSFISLVVPFGALALGAIVRGENVTALAVAGAVLVAGGIAVTQLPIRRRQPA